MPRPIPRCSLGDVVVHQPKNVLQGKRLFVDRKAGTSRLETPADGGNRPAASPRRSTREPTQKAGAQPKPKSTRGRSSAEPPCRRHVLGSFKMDPNAPMDVEADTLDVYDTEKQAVFHGNVKSKQGDFVVRTVEMIAFYTGQARASGRAAATMPARRRRS